MALDRQIAGTAADWDVVHRTRWVAMGILLSVCATAGVAAPFFFDVPVTWHVWAAYLLVIPAVGLLLLSALFLLLYRIAH